MATRDHFSVRQSICILNITPFLQVTLTPATRRAEFAHQVAPLVSHAHAIQGMKGPSVINVSTARDGRGQWLIHRGAPRARAPPYGEDGKYHNLKAEIESFPTVPSTWYFVQWFRCNQSLATGSIILCKWGVGHLPFWTLTLFACWTMSLRHRGPPPPLGTPSSLDESRRP